MKIKAVAAAVLVASTAFTVLASCKSDKTTETTNSAQSDTTVIRATDYTYNIVSKAESETKYIHTVPAIPTEKEENITTSSLADSASRNEETIQKSATGGTVAEESNGLYIITKTSPVSAGSAATVIIQGTPNKEYTIEFYKSETEVASYKGLSEIISDSSGFASWTFEIGSDCEIGNRKIIIKEKNSNKFIQTSITVQQGE